MTTSSQQEKKIRHGVKEKIQLTLLLMLRLPSGPVSKHEQVKR